MKISELINLLQPYENTYGDLEIYLTVNDLSKNLMEDDIKFVLGYSLGKNSHNYYIEIDI